MIMTDDWAFEPADPSVGLPAVVFHEATDACENISMDLSAHSIDAVCSCGAELHEEDEGY